MADTGRTLGEEFDVMLSGGSGKWRLGAFTFKEHNGLRIAAIHSTGALSDWNKAHPDKQVKAGDLLVEALLLCVVFLENIRNCQGQGAQLLR
ncbi:unnamed protein product [Symbiodinium sp. CCMP2592]|nr:unnamed protein product [Symbiodinium sp. CCMP2592]